MRFRIKLLNERFLSGRERYCTECGNQVDLNASRSLNAFRKEVCIKTWRERERENDVVKTLRCREIRFRGRQRNSLHESNDYVNLFFLRRQNELSLRVFKNRSNAWTLHCQNESYDALK